MNTTLQILIKKVFFIILGLLLFYLPVLILTIIDGINLSEQTVLDLSIGIIKTLNHPIMQTFIIPQNLLLTIWGVLALLFFISSGFKQKLFYYIYLAYTLWYSLISIGYALGTWTMPGNHLEGSPYFVLLVLSWIYILSSIVIWLHLPKKLKT